MKPILNITAEQRKALHRGWSKAQIREPFEKWLPNIVWHGDNGEIHVEAMEGWVVLDKKGKVKKCR